MDLELVLAASFAEVADTAAHVATFLATGVLGLWAYSRFVAQQITRPPIEFTVEGEPVGIVDHKRLVRITFCVRNGGTRECDVWLYWRLLGLRNRLDPVDERVPGQVKFGPIHPPGPSGKGRDNKQKVISRKELISWRRSRDPSVYETPPGGAPAKYLPVMDERTFVGTGITQEYEFVTDVDLEYGIAMVLGRIIYMRGRSRFAWLVTPLAYLSSDLSDRETSAITNGHSVAAVVVLEPAAWRPDEGP